MVHFLLYQKLKRIITFHFTPQSPFKDDDSLGCVDHEYRAVSFLWAILARIWCHSPWAGIQPYNRYMALQGMAKKSDVGHF